MSHKLNDTHLMLLSGAAQRPDRCLVPAEALKPAARARIATKLIGLSLVEEVAALRSMPVWREVGGEAFALRITREGAAAIGIELSDAEAARVDAARASSAPRAGSKLAGVIALLSRPEGATLAELTAATDWLPHTARAALTGLRQRGYAVAREASEERGSVYRIAESDSAAAA